MSNFESNRSSTAEPINRRRVLRTGGLAAGAAALLAASGVARAAEADTAELTLDVACDGRTMRVVRAKQDDPNTMAEMGDTFLVYGSIYPAGTIDAGLTGPDQAGAIGRWVCTGTLFVDLASGAVPHAVTNVIHFFGDGLTSTAGATETAVDAIIHQGVEGGVEIVRRSIIGGSGEYTGARGEVVQTTRGENDTLIQLTPEIAVPAPNYTFTFKLAQ